MADYTRRRLLAVGGAITAGAVAGCSGPENAARSESTPEGSAGRALETISLENLDDAVALRRGDAGREPTDEELRAAGIDPESNVTGDRDPPDVLK